MLTQNTHVFISILWRDFLIQEIYNLLHNIISEENAWIISS